VPTAPTLFRDAIWRMIFARPEDAPGADGQISERIALGADLFGDKRLSGAADRACASCHDPAQGFSNGLARGIGRDGAPLKRNVPGLYNLAWGTAFYWDGRAPTLEAQARVPITEPNEMGGDFATIIKRLSHDAAVKSRFARAFPERPVVDEDNIVQALTAYERSLVAPMTRFDAWVKGEDGALSQVEQAGFAIFVGKGGCVACHGGWRFTDDAFHDIGLDSEDLGRGAIGAGASGLPQFRTPGLRELAWSAPYMHDGSKDGLRDVVDHYAGGFLARPSLAANVRRDLSLDGAEKEALVAFLLTLSSER
jgi:cytochrome c peroxidase